MCRQTFVAALLVQILFLYTKTSQVIGVCSNCMDLLTPCGTSSDQGQLSGLCKCDGSCGLYRDCCELSLDLNRNCTIGTGVPNGVEYLCRSVYPDSRIEPKLNEAFWMVSSCPDSWSTDVAIQAVIRDNCSSLSSSLPPVTDLDTGTVYANEFCAVCNRVENILAWQPSLACTDNVYQLLAEMTFQELFKNNSELLQNECQTCSYEIPQTNTTAEPRPCFPAISTCLNMSQFRNLTGQQYSQEEYDAIRKNCINGPYDLLRRGPSATDSHTLFYRNEDCAVCNGDNLYASCFTNPGIRFGIPEQCAPVNGSLQTPGGGGGGIPYTITLSNLGGGQVQVSTLSETVTVVVECPEGQAALGLECRPTLCPEGYVESGGQCAFVIKTINSTNISAVQCLSVFVALNFSDYTQLTNDTVLFNDQVHTVIKYDSIGQPVVCVNDSVIRDSIDCPTGLVALNVSEFTRLTNDTILFKGEVYNVIKFDAVERAIICPPNQTTVTRNTTTYSYPVGYFILTYIGCSLSVVGCALVLLTYGLFKSLRTLPSLILMNLVTAILANNLLIIIGGPVTEAFPSVELCTTVAVCLHFFFLAQFTWMVLMSFQMARTFNQARKLISATEHKRCTFSIYFILGWSIPLLITTVSIIVDFTTDSLVSYGVLSDGRSGSCWINHFESAIVAFIVPLVLTMIINLTLFIVVTVLLCLAARSSNKVDKKQNLAYFRVNTAVFSVTGLTWIFGFIALLAGTSWAWYPFIIFNSTQGFVIFISFLFTKRVLKLYWNLLSCSHGRALSRSSNSTSKSAVVLQAYPKSIENK